jgi:hypothetical protein
MSLSIQEVRKGVILKTTITEVKICNQSDLMNRIMIVMIEVMVIITITIVKINTMINVNMIK